MLSEYGHELWAGDAAEIRASMVRKQKTDPLDALHILELLVTDRFPHGQETRRIPLSTVFHLDEIPGGPLLSAGSAVARTYNLRPEQKLARHTEGTRHEDQPSSARSQPKPPRTTISSIPSCRQYTGVDNPF
jgi:hypothetical protein